ncbi:MAG: cysteine desulfurase family protein [Phycisphaeraceae bacterium]
MPTTYLDNNATTPPAPEVIDAINRAHRELWANPSSVHRFGQSVRQKIELARATVARLIAATPRELLFTSGGTESNNLALHGTLRPALKQNRRAILITTAVEHAAVREPAQQLADEGVNVINLPIDPDGVVNPADLANTLAELCAADDPATALVSIHWANNETGVIQPIIDIAAVVAEARAALRKEGRRATITLHTDATQAVGKLPVDTTLAPVDLMTFAAHKFHGPKGAGVLYLRRGVRLTPQQRGGPQELDRRGGTENTPAILGLAAAAELAITFLNDTERIQHLRQLRDNFEQQLLDHIPGSLINAQHRDRLWNTTSIAFPGVEAEAILLGLSERDVCASAGAACSSGSLEPSPVLLAMGMDRARAHGTIRLSLSRLIDEHDLQTAAKALIAVVSRLRQTMPMAEN